MTKLEMLKEYENLFDAMQPAQENTEEAFACFSGLGHPILNVVMHLRTQKSVRDKVDALISQIPRGIPFSFWVHELNSASSLKEILLERGLQPLISCPLMIWQVQEITKPSHQIKPAKMELFHAILAETLHFDRTLQEGFARLLDRIPAEHYIVYLDGLPVGAGTLFPNGNIGGIFNISILPDYQKRGCGRALMQFLMNRAEELKLEKLVLLSSLEAKKLYSELGFATCLDIELFVR